jgi:hypothetical protein
MGILIYQLLVVVGSQRERKGISTLFMGGWHCTYLNKGGVSHCGLAIYIKKYLRTKEELSKLKYFTMQKYNLQKIL